MSEGRQTPTIQAMHPTSPARLESTVRKKITSIQGKVEDTVVRLGDGGRATETSPDTKVIAVVQTVVNRAVPNAFRSAALYVAVEQVVLKCESAPYIVDSIATRMINALDFTVTVSMFNKQEVVKNSLEMANTDERFIELDEALDVKKIREELQILTNKMELVRSQTPDGFF